MNRTTITTALLPLLATVFFSTAPAQAQAPLTLTRTLPMHGVKGGFDHFAFDPSGMRLFAAAKDNHSVEIIDLATGKLQPAITGLAKPHGLAWVASTGSLYVADGALAELRVYRGSPFALVGTIKLSDDADDMVYDASTQRLFVGHGGSSVAAPARIAVVDTTSFKLLTDIPVKTHPEALDLDPEAHRVFANIADSSEVAVVNAATNAVESTWKIANAKDNVPLAFDARHQLLFDACRTPGTLLALDAASGKELAHQPAAGKADDLFYDDATQRIYLISGAGEVDSYQLSPDKADKTLHPLPVLHTAPGAKTGLFVPSQHLLYIGIPGTAAHDAEVRVFSTSQSGTAQ